MPAAPVLRILLIFAVVAGSSGRVLAQHKLVLNPNRCLRPSEEQLKWFPPGWQTYTNYVRVCPVRNLGEKPVLLLASVRADLYYRAQPGPSVTEVELPSPLLFMPTGQVSGILPFNFPDDPPAELRVTFTRWEHGFPHRIELFLTDPRASGNRNLPALEWDEAQKKFLSKENAAHG